MRTAGNLLISTPYIVSSPLQIQEKRKHPEAKEARAAHFTTALSSSCSQRHQSIVNNSDDSSLRACVCWAVSLENSLVFSREFVSPYLLGSLMWFYLFLVALSTSAVSYEWELRLNACMILRGWMVVSTEETSSLLVPITPRLLTASLLH